MARKNPKDPIPWGKRDRNTAQAVCASLRYTMTSDEVGPWWPASIGRRHLPRFVGACGWLVVILFAGGTLAAMAH